MAIKTIMSHKMNRKKWCDSGIPLVNFNCINASIGLYGGVWGVAWRKFLNKAWIYSQQYRYLLACLEKGFFNYPCPTELIMKMGGLI